jgi:DNA-binding GntR family transcriptional regulator
MTTHSATLREQIEEMIAVGELKPGQHLDETELATRFGVSRTPIRETLIQLASMGLVVIRPRRGAIVAELGPQQLVEMFEVMSELEATCGRLAARRMTPAEQQALLAAHQPASRRWKRRSRMPTTTRTRYSTKRSTPAATTSF